MSILTPTPRSIKYCTNMTYIHGKANKIMKLMDLNKQTNKSNELESAAACVCETGAAVGE